MKIIVFCFILFVKILAINSFQESCETHENCTNPNEVCSQGNCICREFSYIDTEYQRCLPHVFEYGGTCLTESQCQFLKGAVGAENIKCRNNRCICDENMRWVGGKCVKYNDLHEACETNENCYNGYDLRAMICVNKKCQCSDKYYERDGDCRFKSDLCKECALDLDCEQSKTKGLSCITGLCRKSEDDCSDSKFQVNEDQNISFVNKLEDINNDIICESDKDCTLDNMICKKDTKKCVCEDKYFQSLKGYCIFGTKTCKSDNDCSASSTCFNKTACICKPGYFIQDSKCVSELGISLDQSETKKCTHIEAAVLDKDSNSCFCKNTWFNDFSNQKCIKTSTQNNTNCLSNEWCLFLGKNSFCNFQSTSPTGKCSCNEDEPNENFYCEKKTKSDCFSDTDCKLNMKCMNKKCTCSDGFYTNALGECVPKIGSSCVLQKCEGRDVDCKQGICSCDLNFVTNDTKIDCFEKRNLNEQCEIDNQCSVVTENTICDGTCQCKSDYKLHEEKCYKRKYFGSFCSKKQDCVIVLDKDWTCRNSMCQCPVGYKLVDEVKCSSAATININYITFATNLLFLLLSLNKLI